MVLEKGFCQNGSRLKTNQNDSLPHSLFLDDSCKKLVLISLSEVCMLSQYYAQEFENISLKWKKKGFRFVGIFSNAFSDSVAIDSFSKEYRIGFPLFRDEGGKLAQKFRIQINPEILVLDSRFQILYRGKMDDFYVAIGRHKTRKTESPLEEALKQISQGQAVSNPKTQAIGCKIDFSLWKRP
jgi:hypothetical protein